jgi:hypothetical protein
MATDQRSMRPTGSGSAQAGDVGGIPGTMKRGVAAATDRKAARREGLRDDDGATGSTLAESTESGAYAPKEGIDRTGAPAARRDGQSHGDAGSPRRGNDPGAGGKRAADGDESGQDDSVPESLGKSISEPFRSA